MNKKIILLCTFLVIINISSYSQEGEQASGLINWMTFEEAVKLQKEKPKTIFIDMYTDWCGWCKKMDAETFNHPGVAAYINTNFYPVKFDAERKDTVYYNDKMYVNTGEGRRPPHQLAIELLKGKMSYPTIVYIDDEFNVNPISGYMTPDKIEPLIIYFAERVNKSAPYPEFEADFIQFFQNKQLLPNRLNWMTFGEAIEKTKSEPKKTIVVIYSEFNRGSNLLVNMSLNDSTIATYLNEKYYCVKLMAETKDTIKLGEQTFINENLAENYPHQLPIALLQGKMFYPSILFLDENSQIINKTQGYIIPKTMEPFFHYFGDDSYKTTDWTEYSKIFNKSSN